MKTQEELTEIKILKKLIALFDYMRNFVILLNQPDLLKTEFID